MGGEISIGSLGCSFCVPQKLMGGHRQTHYLKRGGGELYSRVEQEEGAGEGPVPAETTLGIWELAGLEGLYWKAVQSISQPESHSAASVLVHRNGPSI